MSITISFTTHSGTAEYLMRLHDIIESDDAFEGEVDSLIFILDQYMNWVPVPDAEHDPNYENFPPDIDYDRLASALRRAAATVDRGKEYRQEYDRRRGYIAK